MSFASWNGPSVQQSLPNNTVFTTVTNNGSNYITNVNVVPQLISRNTVLSTMTDEVVTRFFTIGNVEPGTYKAGFSWQVGTGAADLWQPRDYFNMFVCGQDYFNDQINSNAAAYYKTNNTSVTPYTEGADPISGANGTVQGQHFGFFEVSSIQSVHFCSYMEDFSDNPTTHSVAITDPWIQKIG